MSTPEGLPEHGLSKEPKISQRILRRDGGPALGRRPCSQPSRQPNAGGNAQPRDTAAAHEERGVVIFACSVSMKFGE